MTILDSMIKGYTYYREKNKARKGNRECDEEKKFAF